MKQYKIYTIGKVYGLTYEQQMEWRKQLESLIHEKTDISVSFVHPPMYYDYNDGDYRRNEREIKSWCIGQIYSSDIVIVNLDGIASSIEAIYEVGVVDTINSIGNKFIYGIGVGKYAHSWEIGSTFLRKEISLEDAAEYVVNYLLL